jgi:O-antigen chain-terminating methyltransferase
VSPRDPHPPLEALREAIARIRTRLEYSGGGARAGGPEVDVDALMRRTGATASPGATTEPQRAPRRAPEPLVLPRSWHPPQPLPARDAYSLAELLAYHDVEFVQNAYRAILRREADDTGLAHHLHQLHHGEVAKVELLAGMRNSAEGRKAGVRIRGLRLARAVRSLRRVPLLGALAEMLLYVVRMPTIVRNLERQEVQLFRRERELRVLVDATAGLLETRFDAAAASAASERDAADERLDRVVRRLDAASVDLWRLRAELESRPDEDDAARLGEAALAVAAALEEARAQSLERLGRLEQEKASAAELRAAVERLDSVKANEQAVTTLFADMFTRERIQAVLSESGHRLDALYVAFEERFRGSREDIKRLMAVHLPAVQAANAGTPLAPVLDIGCGRGEWIEVLTEAGLTARGVDLNGEMARQCRERGLDVMEGDALEYLRRLPVGSLGAVTAMHVIEHLPFERLVELFDEAHRVLRPGGLVIFETPNPENLQVGACNFWYDPTHQRPIPPLAAEFIARERGFARAEIMRLHPYPLEQHPQSGDAELRERLVRLLYGPQDYALVAWKA